MKKFLVPTAALLAVCLLVIGCQTVPKQSTPGSQASTKAQPQAQQQSQAQGQPGALGQPGAAPMAQTQQGQQAQQGSQAQPQTQRQVRRQAAARPRAPIMPKVSSAVQSTAKSIAAAVRKPAARLGSAVSAQWKKLFKVTPRLRERRFLPAEITAIAAIVVLLAAAFVWIAGARRLARRGRGSSPPRVHTGSQSA